MRSATSTHRPRRVAVLMVTALVCALTIGFTVSSGAQVESQAQGDPCPVGVPNDDRADCFEGNFPFVPTNDNCATRFGAANEFVVDPPATETSPDGAVTGTVSGQSVSVSAADGWVIIAVVVKGGPYFNVYEPPVSNMVAPQGFSHYAICYGPDPSDPTTTTTTTAPPAVVPLVVAPSFTG